MNDPKPKPKPDPPSPKKTPTSVSVQASSLESIGGALNLVQTSPLEEKSPSSKTPTKQSQAELLAALGKLITGIGGGADLVSAYTVGYTQSRHFFASPDGKKFWTRLEVARHLGLKEKLPPKPSKAKKVEISNKPKAKGHGSAGVLDISTSAVVQGQQQPPPPNAITI